jgi:hypothetical protein
MLQPVIEAQREIRWVQRTAERALRRHRHGRKVRGPRFAKHAVQFRGGKYQDLRDVAHGGPIRIAVDAARATPRHRRARAACGSRASSASRSCIAGFSRRSAQNPRTFVTFERMRRRPAGRSQHRAPAANRPDPRANTNHRRATAAAPGAARRGARPHPRSAATGPRCARRRSQQRPGPSCV